MTKTPTPTAKTPPKTASLTAHQYQQDLAALRAAGPNAVLKAVLTGGSTHQPKPPK